MKWIYTIPLMIFLTGCTRAATTAAASSSALPATPRATATSDAAPQPTFTATPEVDTCLFGKWLIEAESLGAYLVGVISPDSPAEFVLLEVSGELFLIMDEDFKLRLDAQEYVISLDIDNPDSTFNPTIFQLSIPAEGQAQFTVRTGELITFDQDYALGDGSNIGIILSATSLTLAPITLTPNNFFTMMWAPETDQDMGLAGASPKSARYQCDQEELTLSSASMPPITFIRAAGSGE